MHCKPKWSIFITEHSAEDAGNQLAIVLRQKIVHVQFVDQRTRKTALLHERRIERRSTY